MGRRTRVATMAILVALVTSGCAWIARANVDSAGTEAVGGGSADAAVSADGRYVAFTSDATNLVAGDTNRVSDVFVRDNATGTTTRVSVDSNGSQAIGDDNGRGSRLPAISGNGRYVAFSSFAANLVAGDTNMWPDVFVHDTQTGATTRVSVDSDGNEGDGPSGVLVGLPDVDLYSADLTFDGRYVSFSSFAGNLVVGDTNAIPDVFVHDTTTGVTSRVSVDTGGNQAVCPPGDFTCGIGSYGGTISDDGTRVAFSAYPDNLVVGDTNAIPDVFVHDTTTGVTSRVSVDSSGNQTTGTSGAPLVMTAISGDGTRVAFASSAVDLVNGDTNGQLDIFVHDTTTGTTTRVSVNSSGVQSDDSSSFPTLSGDGLRVGFSSDATNLVASDTNTQTDVFVHDLTTGATMRVSADEFGNEGSGISVAPSLSGDGRYVGFRTSATNLVADDTNGLDDIVVRAAEVPVVDTVVPDVVSPGATETLTITGSSFGPGTDVVDPDGITVDSVVVISSTELEVTITVESGAALGPRDLILSVPGPGPGDRGRTVSLGFCGACIDIG